MTNRIGAQRLATILLSFALPLGGAACAGEAGEDGTDGVDGADGAQGPQGADGVDGDDGDDGTDGTNGTNGTNGEDGDDGDPGAAGCAVATPDHIYLPGETTFPEGIAVIDDGTVFISSFEDGVVYKAIPGQEMASPFITTTLTNPAGLVAVNGVLWVCDSDLSGTLAASIAGFNVANGAAVARHDLPTAGGFCNDVIADAAGNLYATDSGNNEIVRVLATAAATTGPATVWAANTSNVFGNLVGTDTGLNGIAYDGVGSLFAVSYTAGELFKIGINATTGNAETPVEITGEVFPFGDGLEVLTPDTLLLIAGNALQTVKITGTTAAATVLSTRFDAPSTLATYYGQAWVVEAQFDNYAGFGGSGSPELPFQVVKFPIDNIDPAQNAPIALMTAGPGTANLRVCDTKNSFIRMLRTTTGLQIDSHIEGLIPGGVYSFWTITTNAPQCFNPANNCSIQRASHWTAGLVVPASGKVDIHEFMPTGPVDASISLPTDGVYAQYWSINATEMTNPMGAVVLFLVKYKGLAETDAALLDAQLHDVDSDCATKFPYLEEALGFSECPDTHEALIFPGT